VSTVIEREPGYAEDSYKPAMLEPARTDPGERYEYGMKVFIDGARAQVEGRGPASATMTT
jgi:hypothetical protein